MQNSLYCITDRTISAPDMNYITTQNGPYQRLKQAISQNGRETQKTLASINYCIPTFYIIREKLRFFAQKYFRRGFPRILRDSEAENLTSPAGCYVFLHLATIFFMLCLSAHSVSNTEPRHTPYQSRPFLFITLRTAAEQPRAQLIAQHRRHHRRASCSRRAIPCPTCCAADGPRC